MSAPNTIRAADALARRLYAAGCRHAFGMPGGEVLTVVDALEAAGIEFILCKHENAAGFMAEAAWHQTGAPGILVATIGPGVLNGINSIANAQQDRVPLIVLSGCVDAAEAETYTHQVLDQQAVLRPITKASFRFSAGAAHVVADKAVGIALEGRPGPVHIDVPISTADALIDAQAPAPRAAAARTALAGQSLDTARDWLSDAQKPVIILGVDAMNEGAAPAVSQFAKTFNIPVITTYKAKGMIDENAPLALGGAGLSPLADKHLVPFVQKSDLIICVGYDPIEMRPGWRDIWDPRVTRVIDITAEPNHHYMHQASLNVIADCAASLAAIADGVTPRATWADDEIAQTKAALAADFPRDEPWGPAAIIDTCRSHLPLDTIATADSGAHRILLSQMWTCTQPRGLLQSSALCTMGCALPLAIGTALCAPDRTVVSFSGDAGFLMIAGELSTAKELGIKPIFIVFVDASLALIELKQRQRQMRNAAVDFGAHDFAAMGQAFGGAGHTATNRPELEAALKIAQSADTFSVIACVIERGAYDGRI
ncbi:thiamine pyrophosphate-binding protein [Sulfitobacter donghicola]|uniref:Acetolactate synthase n=1 Tax=Sulfitobacter donghicola DSW-25 = KCTC 12864 = JCM 14565 TaxID=1300350 RepID=A0A073IJL3_9RHOB|nr:thiamine pyrophosphate-binding protein [Sulfitobacter donghicola]KEJ89790.1 acetolactate synthase [Sulfitobacter donghicola DSW-25 = KCTC 12864 = JCM 14565]KIN67104.1 putative acetolacetate synthase, catabolic [Sulfitobacter donghicola DSW-25 = KCTC 12864 = JCM 14565]